MHEWETRGFRTLGHEQLWAPWRLAYVKGELDQPRTDPSALELLPGADPTCFICRAAAGKDDRANLVIHRRHHVFVLLNRYPYNNGHLLVSPVGHKGRLDELTTDEHAETADTITRFIGLLAELLNAEGFNVGVNLGRAAGAGVPGHLHWHIVPRWSGDTNFMPVLSDVKVISQSLEALWELLAGKLREA
jgi:ATP adenylyltransferase